LYTKSAKIQHLFEVLFLKGNVFVIILYNNAEVFELTFLYKLEKNSVKYKLIDEEEYLKSKDKFVDFPYSLSGEWKYTKTNRNSYL